jgi:hypothetical protein
MKKIIYLVLLLAVVACKKESEPAVSQPQTIKASGGQDTMPTDGTDVAYVDPKAVELNAVEKRGGNGNGNGNTPPPLPEYQKIDMPATDWKVTWDTSWCGWLVMRWENQVRPASTADLEVSPYRIVVTPRDCPYSADCLTNLFYMRYGTSCMMKASSVYDMQVAYTINDKINRVLYYYYSTPVRVYTGVMLCQ